MAAKAPGKAACFFIFDPTLVPESPRPTEEEQADAKILYYCPSCAPGEEKRMQVGLLEGLMAFTAAFGGDKGPLRSLRTKQLAFTVLEAEPHTWMVLAMRHSQVGPDVSKGQTEPTYDEDGIADSTLAAILANCYGVFRLLHGEIQSFVKEPDVEGSHANSRHKLFDLLEDFVPAFLETIDTDDLGIFHEIDGFHYGAVERNTCVSIHCFLQRLQELFPTIRYSALLYNAHLIYSGFSLTDMKVLYAYLVSFNGAVSNHKLNRVPFGRIPTAASQPGGGSSSYGRAFLLTEDEDFLFGVSRRVGGTSGPASLFVPTVYLAEGGVGQLVALTYQGILLILIFECGAQLDVPMLEKVRATCTKPSGDGLSLAELHPLIASQYQHVMEHEDEYRFVYYNRTNHALRLSNQPTGRGSIFGGTRPTGTGGLRAAERAAICPLHAALADPRMRCREVSWKPADRGWICAKRWREREFYLLLDGANVSLSKCQEECAQFAAIHFSNIFMM
eukprot:gnl/TRDRNA2_/TRDRNA2_195144_c0_seq1.p1 gnl/TRDRNA2_/TRDRNA2_195144_c0~~gnl/TRDRNA2_/TRDRNA2_195144_c0_seq1.p1  ORF type:complete len:503 (-),score=84.07 gnl/TRDRNA2_/TRDRNA2_195144_c0_seq1:125-1633(-)